MNDEITKAKSLGQDRQYVIATGKTPPQHREVRVGLISYPDGLALSNPINEAGHATR